MRSAPRRSWYLFLKHFAGGLFVLLFHAHHDDLGEAFFKRRWPQLLGETVHDIIGHHAGATEIAVLANINRDVEEHRVRLIAEFLRHLYPSGAFLRRQVRGINVVPRHACDQARAEQGTEGAENEVLVFLLGDVVEQQGTEQIAGERGDAAAFEPTAFAGAGQSDRQNHYTARRTLRGRRLLVLRRAWLRRTSLSGGRQGSGRRRQLGIDFG